MKILLPDSFRKHPNVVSLLFVPFVAAFLVGCQASKEKVSGSSEESVGFERFYPGHDRFRQLREAHATGYDIRNGRGRLDCGGALGYGPPLFVSSNSEGVFVLIEQGSRHREHYRVEWCDPSGRALKAGNFESPHGVRPVTVVRLRGSNLPENVTHGVGVVSDVWGHTVDDPRFITVRPNFFDAREIHVVPIGWRQDLSRSLTGEFPDSLLPEIDDLEIQPLDIDGEDHWHKPLREVAPQRERQVSVGSRAIPDGQGAEVMRMARDQFTDRNLHLSLSITYGPEYSEDDRPRGLRQISLHGDPNRGGSSRYGDVRDRQTRVLHISQLEDLRSNLWRSDFFLEGSLERDPPPGPALVVRLHSSSQFLFSSPGDIPVYRYITYETLALEFFDDIITGVYWKEWTRDDLAEFREHMIEVFRHGTMNEQ